MRTNQSGLTLARRRYVALLSQVCDLWMQSLDGDHESKQVINCMGEEVCLSLAKKGVYPQSGSWCLISSDKFHRARDLHNVIM